MTSKKHRLSATVFYSVIMTLALVLPNMAFASTIQLPKTGQTKCYDSNGAQISCTGTGQDGEIQAGVAWPNPRFATNADTTITDNLTGLIWEKNGNIMKSRDPSYDNDDTAGDGEVNWKHALDYVAKLNSENYLGHADWRLPNVNELESLVNASVPNPAVWWLYSQGFTNVEEIWYWSSTTAPTIYYDWDNAMVVPMLDGTVSGGVCADKAFINGYVWAVRSGQSGSVDTNYPANIWKTGQTKCYDSEDGVQIPCSSTGQDGDIQAGVAWPSQRFIDNGDDTVNDILTGLMWSKNANFSNGTTTWQQALDYVKTLRFGDYTDWRLPNRKELRSLVDYSRCCPALPPEHPFTNVQLPSSEHSRDGFYWTSSSYAGYETAAWIVSMESGEVISRDKSDEVGYVWAVRVGTGKSNIAQTPISGPPGTTFVQWGSGFIPYSTSTLHFKKPDGSEYPTQTVNLDSIGHFKIRFIAPANKPPGTYIWWGIDDSTGRKSNEVSYTIEAVAGELDHFNFSTIANQTKGISFPVTIEAKDANGNLVTSFNGSASLLCSVSMPVQPSYCTFTNGRALNVPVTLPYPANNLRLICQSAEVSGQSNVFNVTGSGGTGTLMGSVRDMNNIPLPNSRVEISLDNFSSVYASVDTGALSNKYTFGTLPPGHYWVRAKFGGKTGTVSEVYVNPGACSYKELTVVVFNGKPPVILVPGIMGSDATWDANSTYPGLPAKIPAPQNKLELHNPLDVPGWNTIKGALYDNYQTYDCPYDWRLHFKEKYDGKLPFEQYLLPIIKKAKDPDDDGVDEWPRVDIVAHSMGGLLVRSYIQSEHYNNDIGKFAMVGTPNHGSLNVYDIWEGGDPKLFEDALELVCGGAPYFYTHTVDKMYDGKFDLKLFDYDRYNFICEYATWKEGMNQNNVLSLAWSDCKSARQLLPTFACLNDDGDVKKITTPRNENTWLDDLNNTSSINYWRMMSKNKNKPGAVQTKIFGSSGQATVWKIDVDMANKGRYADGRSTKHHYDGEEGKGDGTVLWDKSAKLGDDVAAETPSSGEHAELIKENAAAITGFLNEDRTFSSALARSVQRAMAVEPAAELGITVAGMTGVFVTVPGGQRCGFDDGVPGVYEEITGATMERDGDRTGMRLPDPATGTYTVVFTGSETGTSITLTLSYRDNEASGQAEARLFYNGSPVSFQFTLNPTAFPILQILSVPAAPAGLAAKEYTSGGSRLTRLTWEAVTSPGLTGYRIYSRTMDNPFYTLLATVSPTETSYQTGHLWKEPLKVYCVSAIDNASRESFLSGPVTNYIALSAAFSAAPLTGKVPLAVTFTDDSAGDVTGWLWSFGDGGTSTEQNPSHTYTGAGTFTVSLKAICPDGEDILVKADFITVSAQPTTTTSTPTGGGGGGGTTIPTTSTPIVTTTTIPKPPLSSTTTTVPATTTSVPANTTTTTAVITTTTTTASTGCQIKSIQPSGIQIGFGLLPRIRRVTLTMNTDLEALGITCADLNIQNAPRGIRIISCDVVGDTIEATILFWGVQPGTYNLNIGQCGTIPFIVSRF